MRRYKQEVEARLNPLLGHKLLKDIKRRDVQSLIDSCATYKIAKTARDVLRQILNYAIQDGFIHINVAAQSYDFPERTSSPSKANTPRATPCGCRDFLAYYKRLWSQTDSHVSAR